MISVLHVDDDTGILDLTRLFLEKSENVSVDCVESAHAALDKIGEQSYDVIISDYQMPGMDGIEFLKDLRSRGDNTPFIIFTGKGREDVVIDAFENGADYYIQKGGNPKAQYAELIQKIRKAVELRRAEEARQESEEQLLQIIGELPDATFAIDTDGRVIAWNRAIEEMTGVSAEEMLGKGGFEYAIPFYGERRPTLADMVLSPDLDAPGRQGIFHRQGGHLYLQTQFARPRGQESILWAKASPLHDRTGRLKGAIESIRDITRWKKMEDSLRESEEKYRQLVENANEIIMVVQEGRIRFCNPRVARLLGRSPIDLDGLAIVDFIHPDDRGLVMDRHQRRAAGEDVPTNYQFRIVSSTGTVHWVLVNSARIVWKERPALLVLLSDISAQKEAEHDLRVANEDLAAANEELTSQIETIAQQNEDLHAAYEQLAATEEELRQNYEELEQSQALLKESEARYRLIVETAQEGVWQMDEAMKTVFVNRAMAEMLGYTEEEMLGQDIREFIPANEQADQDSLIDLRRTGESSRYERTFVRKDGGTIVASVSATPVIDDQGRFRGSFAMLTEITGRKMAGEALRESEERYRSLFDQSSEGIYLHDLEGNILDVNHAAVTQSGYSRDELLQMTVFDLHPENADDRDDILRQWHDWAPEQPVTLETIHRRKDGSLFPAEVRTGIVRIGDGMYMLALVQDITERKRAGEALRRSEERYRMITDNMTETISIMDLSLNFTYVSPSIETLRGFSTKEALEQSLADVLTPESLEIARERFTEEIQLEQKGGAEPGRTISLDLEEYRRDGSTIWVNNTLKFLRDGEGRPTSILIVSRDVTDRILAEQETRESEEKFRTIFENSPYPIAINRDRDFTFLEVNRAFLKTSGYSGEEIIGKSPMDIGLLSVKEVGKLLARRLLSGKLENVPLALTVKNGKRVHVLFSTMPVTINNEQAIVTVTAEVTQLKRIEEELLHKNEELSAACEELTAAQEELRQNYEELSRHEAALRENEEKFRAIVEHSLEGIFIVDFTGMLLFANQAAAHVVDEPDLNRLVGRKNVLDFVAAESREDVVGDFQNVAQGNDAYLVHYKLVTETGREVWVECIGKKVPFGDSSAMLVSMRDITERILADDRLRESENKFATAFHGSPAVQTIVSATDGSFVNVNDAFVERMGYSREEVIGKTADDLGIFVDENEAEDFRSALQKGRAVHDMELRIRSKSGEIQTTLFTSGIIMIGGKPHILSTIQNITERKIAEGLHRVMVGTTGLSSLRNIAQNVYSWLNADCVMILETEADGRTAKTLAMIRDGEEIHDFSMELKNSPCGNVVEKGFCLFRDDAVRQFPENRMLAEMGIQGYMGTPLRDSDGNIIGVLCVMSRNPLSLSKTVREYMDLIAVKVAAEVERLRIERELEENRRLLGEAMDLAQLVHWECDVPTETFTFDDQFYRMYGTSAEREGGTRMSADMYAREFVHPDDRHFIAEEMEKARQTTDPDFVSQIEHRIIRRDGEIRDIVVRFGVVLGEHGRTIKTYGANQDITERKAAEEALRRAHRQIQILTGITRHDILNSIMIAEGYLDLLPDAEPDEQKEYLERTLQIIARIQRQIEFTRQYENLGSQEPQWVDLNAIIDDLEVPDSIHLDTVGIERRIFSDPMLQKVFANLLDNTIRHGGAVTRIRVTGTETDDGLQITWQDDGVGIPDSEKEKIFEQGFGRNTGLGLFLAREILALTGISITETGREGEGARFEVSVPMERYRNVTPPHTDFAGDGNPDRR